MIEVGDVAPDFELAIGPGRVVRLADLRGGPVALAFYGADWNPLCGDQLRLYSENLDSLNIHNACLVGISADGPWSHQAYAEALSLRFPLAADFEPKGAVARSYGVYRDDDGVAEPALFVIDGTGRIAWNHVSPMDVNPGLEGILEALCTLKKPYSHVLAGTRYLTPPVGIGDHVRGSDHASVTLVEYGDYECSHCGAAHAMVGRLLSTFPESLRFVFRNFPLTEIHTHAQFAAVSAEAAGALGKFWPMHDKLFGNQRHLRSDDIIGYALAVHLEPEAFMAECVRTVWQGRVRGDLHSGVASAVNGSPTFFINGKRHDGSPDFASLAPEIRAAGGLS